MISLQSKGLNSLLQHHNSKVSVLQHSACFMVQLSHLYMTTGKAIALTIRIFFGKVMSLHFNMLSRFVIAFLRKSRKVKMKSLSRIQLFETLWTVAHQAPQSMGFSRQENWSGVPLPSPFRLLLEINYDLQVVFEQ